ncbi:MAG: hypothetical protein ACE5KR_05035, partial [Candidatus Bipolaricaulia bacterium]
MSEETKIDLTAVEEVGGSKGVACLFGESVSTISQVRYVAVWAEDGTVHLWTIIPKRDREVQRKIYGKELEILERFPAMNFDFNIIF